MIRQELRGESVYCVFTRNFTTDGSLKALTNKLTYIKDLGATIIWLMPHYPVGKNFKNGHVGSPYAIKSYTEVDPELGTLSDFEDLVDRAHSLGLRIIIDIVFNHASLECPLVSEKPQWFIKQENGKSLGKVPHWNDVIDFNYNNKELWDYLISVLKFWSSKKIDGFRCDVASIIPLDFWDKAKKELDIINNGLIWIGESVDKEFISFIRHKGFMCHSDSELYNVFHVLYDYDINWIFLEYISGTESFKSYVRELRNQEVVYPVDYLKLRFLETPINKKRITSLIKNQQKLKNWKGFSIFQKGIPLIYNGEELAIKKQISLESKDPISWDNQDTGYKEFITRMLSIIKSDIVKYGIYTINPLISDCVHLRYRYMGRTLHGIFNFGEKNRFLPIEILSGSYTNIIDNSKLVIGEKGLKVNNAPYIFESIP